MELWIPITLAAAFSQNIRSALQKHFSTSLGATGATFLRFAYGFPFAVIYLLVLNGHFEMPLPHFNGEFFAYVFVGGMAQIIATFLLVYLFRFKNFAVGTAYSKTEPIQAAIFGLIFLGEHVSPGGAAAIALGTLGVIAISLARGARSLSQVVNSLIGRTALIGLASGAAFGLSAVCYRGASLSLGGPNFLMQAAYTLVWATFLQTLVMTLWMGWRDRGQLKASLAAWRSAFWVGVSGIVGSACWFTAMTLQNVAYVRMLGQVELIFSFAMSVFFFREKITGIELLGCLLIGGGIVLLLSP
jgi:drug/metabolite transporter (DMT)-like permease